MFATAVLLTLSTKTAVAILRIILYNVANSEEDARLTARGPRQCFAPPGYWSRLASQIAARRRTSESKPLGQQNIEELQANAHVVAGTPDTVLKKPRLLKDELHMGHLGLYGQESRMSHTATMCSIALFGKEVMPAMHEW